MPGQPSQDCERAWSLGVHGSIGHTQDPRPKRQLRTSVLKTPSSRANLTQGTYFHTAVFFQDIGKDRAREVRAVVLALPRSQLQPDKRQKYFPRARDISFRASPASLLIERQQGAPFSQLHPCSILHYPKGLNHAFCQSV